MADIRPEFYFNTPQVNDLLARLRSLDESEFANAMLDVTRLVGVKLEELVVDYPPQPEPRTTPGGVDPETGEIKKPRKRKRYKRTGRLGASITSEPRQYSNDTWVAAVGSNVVYSPYVIGEPSDNPGQAWFHQGVWTPLRQDILNNLPAIRKLIVEELTRRINAYIA